MRNAGHRACPGQLVTGKPLRSIMAQLKVSRPTPQRGNRRSTVSPLLWELAQGDPAVALKTMEASLEGLTDAEVGRRRRIYGKNEVAHEKPPPWWVQFLKAFSSPFIL